MVHIKYSKNKRITLNVAADSHQESAGKKTNWRDGDINERVQDVTNKATGRGFSAALITTCLVIS